MTTVIVTRPPEDAASLIRELQTAGCRVLFAPMLEIRFREAEEAEIPEGPVQAVAITSANGARALARLPAMARLRAATAVVVGPASERAAREAGFEHILRAERGDVSGVIATIRTRMDPSSGVILYASGAVTRGDLEGELARAGFNVHRAVLYEAVPARALSPEVRAHLRQSRPGWVTLFSPRTARIWADATRAEGLAQAAARLDYACLSENVRNALLEAMPSGVTGRIVTAATPDQSALLAALGLKEA